MWAKQKNNITCLEYWYPCICCVMGDATFCCKRRKIKKLPCSACTEIGLFLTKDQIVVSRSECRVPCVHQHQQLTGDKREFPDNVALRQGLHRQENVQEMIVGPHEQRDGYPGLPVKRKGLGQALRFVGKYGLGKCGFAWLSWACDSNNWKPAKQVGNCFFSTSYDHDSSYYVLCKLSKRFADCMNKAEKTGNFVIYVA